MSLFCAGNEVLVREVGTRVVMMNQSGLIRKMLAVILTCYSARGKKKLITSGVAL